MNRKQYWEQVYSNKASDSISWFQEHADLSLRLIHNKGLGNDALLLMLVAALPNWWMIL